MKALSISLPDALPSKALQAATEIRELVRLALSQHPAEHSHHLTTTDLDGGLEHENAINFIALFIACKGFSGCDRN